MSLGYGKFSINHKDCPIELKIETEVSVSIFATFLPKRWQKNMGQDTATDGRGMLVT